MITHGFTLHEPGGRLAWIAAWNLPPLAFVGSFPWDWLVPADRDRCRAAFAFTAAGQATQPETFLLAPEPFGGDRWGVTIHFRRSPSQTFPIAGIGQFFHAAALRFSPRERQTARLLPSLTASEIAAALDVSPRSVETYRRRIAGKLDAAGLHQVIAWCALNYDVL